MFGDLTRSLALLDDVPETSHVRFGFDEYARNTATFIKKLESKPFSIVIDGEWGSGKTTLLKKIKEHLDYGRGAHDTLKTVFFEAWKYEQTDIFSSLLYTIKDEFGCKKPYLKMVASFTADAILRKTINMSKKDALEHFKGFRDQIDGINDILSEKIDRKLVILIDDLDRCDTDNTIAMLERLKLFLMIKNVIFVIAVDMEKVEKAWELKYHGSAARGVGRDHTEKMFQLRLSVPHKSEREVQMYIEKMAESLGDENIQFFASVLPPNPRKIKLALNFVNFTMAGLREEYSDDSSVSSPPDESYYLCMLIAWIAVMFNKDAAEIVKNEPAHLIHAACMCGNFDDISRFKNTAESCSRLYGENKNPDFMVDDTGLIAHEYVTLSLLKMFEIAGKDKHLFTTLQRFGKLLHSRMGPPTQFCIVDKSFMKSAKQTVKIFNDLNTNKSFRETLFG